MLEGVRCFVEECKFNEMEDHLCSAPSIEVTTNGNDVAGTSRGTMCQTFVYREYVFRDASRDWPEKREARSED